MDEFQRELITLLTDSERLRNLLLLEKERRDTTADKLVFIGMRNVAHYYWCAMEAVFRSRSRELKLFKAYLGLRLYYSYLLGLINEIPKQLEALLRVGNELKIEDIETDTASKIGDKDMEIVIGTGGRVVATATTTDSGEVVATVHPDLPSEKRKHLEDLFGVDEDSVHADSKKYPMIRGQHLEMMKAEQYPTASWNFEWRKYVIGGTPEGITDDFVYEFKTTKNNFLMMFYKPVALVQADLYGYFFGRDVKRVQMYIEEKNEIETWEQKVDKTKVETVLKNFRRVDEGWLPPPPKSWKCNSCEFLTDCAISPLS